MRLAQLDTLDLPAFLPGETPTLATHAVLGSYTPDGELIDATDYAEGYAVVKMHRKRPGNDLKATRMVEGGSVEVSTVYMGLDHQYGDGPILIWETMVFGLGDDDYYQWRYSTRAAATAGHEKVVEILSAALDGSGRS